MNLPGALEAWAAALGPAAVRVPDGPLRAVDGSVRQVPAELRPGTVEGRVKSMNRLMERAPFLRYSALSLRRQALQMQ